MTKTLCIMLKMFCSDNSRVTTFGHTRQYFARDVSWHNICDLWSTVNSLLSDVCVLQKHLRNEFTVWLYSPLIYIVLSKDFQCIPGSLKQTSKESTES